MSPIGQRRCDNEIKPRTGRTFGDMYSCVPLRAIAQAKNKEEYWVVSETEGLGTLKKFWLII